MKKLILTFIAALLALPSYSQLKFNPADFEPLKNTSYAFYAKYIGGQELLSINKDLRLAPASILKLMVSAAVMDAYGPDKKFETKIYYDGKLKSGVLKGNIYIAGGGDPMLGAGRAEGNMELEELMGSWAAAVKAAGIKKIKGNIYADASLFCGLNLPSKVLWEDMGNYFGATSDALTINENAFAIYFKDGSVEIDRIEPHVEGIEIKNLVTMAEGEDEAEITAYAAPGQTEITLEGRRDAKVRNYAIWVSLPNPPLFAAQKFKETLVKNGIKVSGTADAAAQTYADKALIHTHFSPPLSEILLHLNRRSINIYSEILLKHLALAYGFSGDTAGGVQALESFLIGKGISAENFKVYDGSGLSRHNIITASNMAQTLEYMAAHAHAEAFFNVIIGAEYMSSYKRKDSYKVTFSLIPAAADLRLKTGFLTGVRTYAGYINDYNGKKISFAFLVNNYTEKTKEINAIFDGILLKITEAGKPAPVKKKTNVRKK